MAEENQTETHVFLLEQFISSRLLLLISGGTKEINKLSDGEESNLSSQLCHPAFFFIGFGTTECFLLAAVAYDHYIASCNPLLYLVVMSHMACILLVTGSCVLGLLHALVHTSFTFRLPSCQPAKVNPFYCEIMPVLAISYSDSQVNRHPIFGLMGLVEMVTILAVLVSYAFILLALSKISSAKSRYKTFSTYTSHLSAVSIFHGSILALNFQPSSSNTLSTDKIFSVFYLLLVPMLKPLIYSLGNREVKNILREFVTSK